jgi:hypothetical protein
VCVCERERASERQRGFCPCKSFQKQQRKLPVPSTRSAVRHFCSQGGPHSASSGSFSVRCEEPSVQGAFPFGVWRKAPARLRPLPYLIRSPAARWGGASVFFRGMNFAIFSTQKFGKSWNLRFLRVNLTNCLKFLANF